MYLVQLQYGRKEKEEREGKKERKGRKEGREEWKEGRKEGRKEGKKERRKEGRKEGRKMTSDLKENSSQNLGKQARNMEEKFSNEMEIIKNTQVVMLEMKTSINQIKPQLIVSSVDKIK
jgi:flagellar biosynthesis/type III secretory pathway protein FliH